jgi:Subtilase family.
VGPQIDLFAVKVLNSQGTGYLSDVIEWLDWSKRNSMQVVNMSFGMSTDSQSLHDAIFLVNQSGIVQIASAGNNYGGSVSYPAAYPEVISVSATDSSN